MSWRKLFSVLAVGCLLSLPIYSTATDLDGIRDSLAEKNYAEVERATIEALERPAASSDEKVDLLMIQGKGRQMSKEREAAIASYQQCMAAAKDERAGEAAYRLGGLYKEMNSSDLAKSVLEPLSEGKIQSSDLFRGYAAFTLATMKLANFAEKDKGKELLLALDCGAIPSAADTRQKARYALGHVYAKSNDFLSAYNAFCRADFQGRGPEFEADLAMQRVWTLMEYCRRLKLEGKENSEFSFENTRILCQATMNSITSLQCDPSLYAKPMAVMELMYLETYYYEGDYAKVPALVDAYLERHGKDSGRKRECAMAHFWKPAAYHRMGKYTECLVALDEFQGVGYSEDSQRGFMNVPAYVALLYADSYFMLGDIERTSSQMIALQTQYPEFVKNRQTLTDRYAVLETLSESVTGQSPNP